MAKLKIGSRDSALALAQTAIVADCIKRAHPGCDIEVVALKTTGDKILDRPLDKIGGKGLFVKELDEALLSGDVDITVHSMKDLPMELNPLLPLVAIGKRADPRDALVLPEGRSELDLKLSVGCSSKRRCLQLQELFGRVKIEPIRGNLQTRLRKLDGGLFGATLLACAGLERMGLQGRISRAFSVQEMMPAACQGIIAVQGREGFEPNMLGDFHDEITAAIACAERSFTAALDGGCSSPVAAYATIEGDVLRLEGMYVGAQNELIKGDISGDTDDGYALGRQLAAELKARAKEANHG